MAKECSSAGRPARYQAICEWEQVIKTLRGGIAAATWDDPQVLLREMEGCRLPLANIVEPTLGGGNTEGAYDTLADVFKDTPGGYLAHCPNPPGGEVDVLLISDSSMALVPDPKAGKSSCFSAGDLLEPWEGVRKVFTKMLWGKGLRQIVDAIPECLDDIEDGNIALQRPTLPILVVVGWAGNDVYGEGGYRGVRWIHRAEFNKSPADREVFSQHCDLVQNLKAYESLSSGSTPDPKGLVHSLAMVNPLLELSPLAELHPQPLRDALLRLLSEKPMLNNSGFAGQAWVHQRAERVNVLLAHIRKLARSGPTAKCAGNLTGLEYSQLCDTLKKVQLRPEEPLQNGAIPLRNGDDEEQEKPAKKKLKKNNSDVSLDSQGFPMMLKTPEHEKKTTAKPSRLLQKRVGQSVHQPEPKHDNLKEAMGLKSLKKGMKKPAAAGALKKPAAATESTGRWLKIYKTTPKKKARAYLCGTKAPGDKPKLIVEVTGTMSKQYILIIEKIKEALENDNISKEDALEMRKQLCKKFP
eukprot:s1529_g13.t1